MKIFIILLLFSAFKSNDLTIIENNENIVQDDKEPLIVRSVDENPNLPKETQMAQCTVQSGDIKASAQATFSKKLEGFCSTDDMKMLRETLVDMEARLYRDIYNLQQIIRHAVSSGQREFYSDPPPPSFPPYRYYEQRNPHDQQNYYHERPRNYESAHNKVATATAATTTTSTTPASTFRPFPPAYPPTVITSSKLKSLETSKDQQRKRVTTTVPTTTTIKTSLTTEEPKKIKSKNEYTYYWKLDQFPKVFQHAKKQEVFSHVFNVKGLYLRIRASMNYLENESLSLDIEHLANVDNEKMEIEISDGLIFKEIAEEKLFQYIFAILDQANPNHDLISPVFWNNENEDYMIPNSVHLLSSYVKDNSILIKLTISF